MKIASFLVNSKAHVGVVYESSDTIRVINSISSIHELVAKPTQNEWSKELGEEFPLSKVKLLPPIIPKRNIICVGKNYHAHAREFAGSGYEAGAVKGAEIDKYPAVFSKAPSTVIGHEDTVSLHPKVTSEVDYEAELALIIGKGGSDISPENAFDHIWGYTIVNDVTARDRQKNHKQWFLGKTLDTFCPMGPWITTADEIDGTQLDLQCWVNGEIRQSANTRDLIFDIPTLISTISAGMALQPGDVIATGTPAGVGIGFTPPRFLKSGDEVKITISGIGTLSNRFAA